MTDKSIFAVAFVIVISVIFVTAVGFSGKASTSGSRMGLVRGVSTVTDPVTHCQYLVVNRKNGITPRLDEHGRPISGQEQSHD